MTIRFSEIYNQSGILPRWIKGLLLSLLLASVGGAYAQTPAVADVTTQAAAPASVGNVLALGNLPGTAAGGVPAVNVPTAVPAPAYGVRTVWAQGDGVARLTMVLLAGMSLLSWYIIIAKLLEQRRLDLQARAAKDVLSGTDPLAKRMEILPKDSVFRFMVDNAFAAARRHPTLAGQVEMNAWLSQDIVGSVTVLQMRSQSGLSALATVGSTAPFVGLFGTVWGIFNALVTIGASGQASIDKVAGPVGEALIMTAFGLAVAVPAVLAYNWLVRRNRISLHALRVFGSELHTQLLVEIDKLARSGKAAPASA